MKNWKDIALPERMKALPKDKRGYPVPFIILRDKNDLPHFTINDDKLVEECLHKNLCAICGERMGSYDKWLVGGPLSAFHSHGSYIDTPLHHECLHYALQVCPYLAVTRYQKRIDIGSASAEDFGDTMVFKDPTQDDTRVPFFVAVNVRRYEITRPDPISRYLVPRRDYMAVEFWNGGQQITREEAVQLWRDHPSGAAHPQLVQKLANTLVEG